MTAGIEGKNSGLIHQVFRLLRTHPVPWVLLENVPFMLQLGAGRAIDSIASTFEQLGYRWAYRTVDTRAFGLPQRRKRVFFLASRRDDPATVLFVDDAGESPEPQHRGKACGFYWTEGLRGLGWAVDSVPTLKGGSTVGIPSPPAIWMPDGRIVTPDIRDAERLQGFEADWTIPAARVVRPTFRWKLIGNAVSVPVSEWIGQRLSNPARPAQEPGPVLRPDQAWPPAACLDRDGRRRSMAMSGFPVRSRRRSTLISFLKFETKPLSVRATAGFLSRLVRSGLDYPIEFRVALEQHLLAQRVSATSELASGYVDSR